MFYLLYKGLHQAGALPVSSNDIPMKSLYRSKSIPPEAELRSAPYTCPECHAIGLN